jgi:GNAT superfamily N-acetyltransferase
MQEFRIEWCKELARAREIAEFFSRNVSDDVSYISHGELQGARALSPTQWRQPLSEILLKEIEPRIAETRREGAPGPNSKPILVAEDASGLVAITFVTFDSQWTPYAIIEDLVVDTNRRGLGLGKAVIDWITEEAQARGVHRLMLESGVKNERAHEFFQRENFVICSKVMIREI